MIGRQAFCGNRVFYFFKFFFCIHIYDVHVWERCMHGKRECVLSYMWLIEVDCSSLYILRQGHSLTPEFTTLASVASQLALEIPNLHISCVLGWWSGYNTHPRQLGSGNVRSSLHACMASILLSHHHGHRLFVYFCRHDFVQTTLA